MNGKRMTSLVATPQGKASAKQWCRPMAELPNRRRLSNGVKPPRWRKPGGTGHDEEIDTVAVRRYLTFMKTTVSSKGQIVLPAEFRQQDRIEPGQEFDVERLDRGDYRLVRRAARPNDGAVDWLLGCPEKGFFVPIDSESTDTL